MEVYIDDMMVKSQQAGDHIKHLSDTFQILHKFNMKLNPAECAFGVSLALKKQNQFEWSEECQQAIKNLKVYLSNPPLLAKPKDGEKLLIYLDVLEVAIPREENVEADTLANLASAAEVTKEENASVIHLFHSVLDQDKTEYGILPEDKKKAQALRQNATRYCLNQDNLYKKMLGGPLARCLGLSQTEYVMKEIHERYCGNHAGGRSLVKTIIRAGYYWPKMEEEAKYFVAKCDKCQRYGNNMHRPAELLHPVVAPWRFMKWGMDIGGPLPQPKGKVRFLLVLTDYFTKWVKAGVLNKYEKKR
ncbi:uncharacterized protein LOC142162110 [Nicotiana tabacum]|uniref:Uncharacterized protein LOC142162110 n=1 Tax=Nicotiana tabacum TaxID=4097 RepID=A0AC58RP68_TOBAC